MTGLWALLESQGLFRDLPMAGGRAGSVLYFLAALVPIRFLEWGVILFFFYDRGLKQPIKGTLLACAGILWSFLLDLPAILGLVYIVSSIC